MVPFSLSTPARVVNVIEGLCIEFQTNCLVISDKTQLLLFCSLPSTHLDVISFTDIIFCLYAIHRLWSTGTVPGTFTTGVLLLNGPRTRFDGGNSLEGETGRNCYFCFWGELVWSLTALLPSSWCFCLPKFTHIHFSTLSFLRHVH